MKLLIVDDDTLAGKVATILGAQLGFDTAYIEKLEDIDVGEVLGYDVILLDLMMPGFDGIQWLRLLARLGSRAQIILISGLNQKILKQARIAAIGYQLDVVATIQKPISKARLRAALDKRARISLSEHDVSTAPKITNSGRVEKALALGEFDIFLQPQINLQTGEWQSNEALARWCHPTQGVLPPASFLHLLEGPSLLLAFALLILEKGLAALQYLQSSIGFNGTIAVNVAPMAMAQLDFSDQVFDLLRTYDIDPQLLVIEITETEMTGNESVMADIQARLAIRGVTFSADDFGTGLSSVERLQRVPCDELKIDRQFIVNLASDRDAQKIAHNMIRLAHGLGMRVVAEGIEDEAAKNWLTAKGCDIGQGFLISKPLPISQLIEWSQARPKSQSR